MRRPDPPVILHHVCVQKDGMLYLCMAVKDRGGLRIKCGKCHHGNIMPEEGNACAVCGAVVAHVRWLTDIEREKAIRYHETMIRQMREARP